MNPSAKAAGLSFQLSSPIDNRDGLSPERRQSDVRRPAGLAGSVGARVCSHSDREYFTRRRLTRRNLASIRLSKCVAVCSRSERFAIAAQSAFTYPKSYPTTKGIPIANLSCKRLLGSHSSSPVNGEASWEQPR
jgi:hypothetical protein